MTCFQPEKAEGKAGLGIATPFSEPREAARPEAAPTFREALVQQGNGIIETVKGNRREHQGLTPGPVVGCRGKAR